MAIVQRLSLEKRRLKKLLQILKEREKILMEEIKKKCEAIKDEENFARDELKTSWPSLEASTSISINSRSNMKKENH